MESLENMDFLSHGQDAQPATPDSPALKLVSETVAEWDKTKGDIKKAEAFIAGKKQRIIEIEQTILPNAMAEAGVASFTTTSGRSVIIDEVINGNIPALTTIEKLKGPDRAAAEKRRAEGLAVVAAKWPGLIKTELSVSLGKGEREVALRMAELLREQFEVDPSIDETIHPASLNSHFKELKNDGKLEEIPVETFNLYVGPIAKIK